MTAISVSERLLEMAAFYTPLALTVTEVNAMLESFCNLLIGIGASVIGTYICKWLDDRNKGN